MSIEEEEDEDDSSPGYMFNVSTVTSDDVFLIMELNLHLTASTNTTGKWTPTDSWLDNHYKPEVEKAVRRFVSERTCAEIKARTNIGAHLSVIAMEVFNDLTLPQ